MRQATYISSPQNATLKKWRQLQQSRKERYRRNQLLIEGERMLTEAKNSHCHFHAIIFDDKRESLTSEWHAWARERGIPAYSLRPSLYRQLMNTETPQGIAAVIGMPKRSPFVMNSAHCLVLLLDQIQDPGNLGTILRTAAAAGVSFVGMGKGTVDPYNPKVVRSAAGAIFHIPFDAVDLPAWMEHFRAAGGTVIGTAADAGTVYYDVAYPDRTAFLLGNEGQGITPSFLRRTDRNVRIPIPGRSESLNVATASALLIYETLRQRGQNGDTS